jgi:hypothetical protein
VRKLVPLDMSQNTDVTLLQAARSNSSVPATA